MTPNYFEILEEFSAEDVRKAGEARALQQDSSVKQFGSYDFDTTVLDKAKAR